MEAPKKRRKPVLLIAVASLSAATILYLEFFADPIIDPPEFLSDGDVQVQYLTARSPFSRRVVFRLAAVDRTWRPSLYEFRGRDVVLNTAGAAEIVRTNCLVVSDDTVHVGSQVAFDLLWDHRGYVDHLRKTSMAGRLQGFLNQVAEEGGDLHLSRVSYPRTYGKGD